MKTDRFSLEKPSMELVSEVQGAILESRIQLEKYLGWVQSSLDNPQENMHHAIENHNNNSNELRYYLVENKTATVLGAIGLIIRDAKVPFFEIGYWIRTSKVGHGYITEAVRLLETYAFNELGAKRIEIRMAKCNSNSRAVAVRCGYACEAELKNERRLPSGELSDTVVFRKCSL